MNSIKRRPVILDGDPGHDDAIAWVLAAASPELEIKAMTSVAGNQTIEKTTYNGRRIAALLHLTDVPFAAGREKPLLGNLEVAANFHGVSGLDGPALPEPDHPLSELSSVELMAKVLRESKEKVTIIATGTQTNVGALLLAHPELKDKIELISIMGGGLRNGNWTCGAEFNILNDPEAAYIEFNSGVPLQMCGLDVTEKALVYPEEWERIRQIGNPVAKVVAEWFDFFFIHVSSLGWKGATLHDPCAVMSLIHPEIFTMKDAYVQIETQGQYCRGATVADFRWFCTEKPNCRVVLDLDREKFVEYLIEACCYYDGWEV